jgi:Ca2+-binding EF-hand superfamily protein
MTNSKREFNSVRSRFYDNIVVGFPLTDKQFSHVVKLFDKQGEGTINYNTFIDKISKYEKYD